MRKPHPDDDIILDRDSSYFMKADLEPKPMFKVSHSSQSFFGGGQAPKRDPRLWTLLLKGVNARDRRVIVQTMAGLSTKKSQQETLEAAPQDALTLMKLSHLSADQVIEFALWSAKQNPPRGGDTGYEYLLDLIERRHLLSALTAASSSDAAILEYAANELGDETLASLASFAMREAQSDPDEAPEADLGNAAAPAA